MTTSTSGWNYPARMPLDSSADVFPAKLEPARHDELSLFLVVHKYLLWKPNIVWGSKLQPTGFANDIITLRFRGRSAELEVLIPDIVFGFLDLNRELGDLGDLPHREFCFSEQLQA